MKEASFLLLLMADIHYVGFCCLFRSNSFYYVRIQDFLFSGINVGIEKLIIEKHMWYRKTQCILYKTGKHEHVFERQTFVTFEKVK